MTVESTQVRTAFAAADGTNKTWSYNFRVLSASDLVVIVKDSLGVQTVHTSNFSWTPTGPESGSVNYPDTGAALAPGNSVRLERRMTYKQPTAIGNQGAFYPQTHEDAFDRTLMQVQETKDVADRALVLPVDDARDPSDVIDDVFDARDTAVSAKNAAAASATAAGTSETNAAASATAASTSATNASNSATAAATSETNAGNSASAASTSETNAANSASAAATTYDNFDDRYLGAKASDPSLDNDGDALLTGALYWNTTTDKMRVWDGAAWLNVVIVAGNLDDLNDVDLTTATPVSGDGFVFNGTKWVPGPAGGGMFKGNNGTVGSRSGDLFRVNAKTLNTNTTIAGTENASVTGPLTVASGVTLTVASGGTLRIL